MTGFQYIAVLGCRAWASWLGFLVIFGQSRFRGCETELRFP